MATKRIYNMGTRATEFSKLIQSMTGKHQLWEIWADFVTMAACCISNSVEFTDCACGGGAMLIAAANAVKKALVDTGYNWQDKCLFVGQDLDGIAAKMCYIQLSLLGCAGFVKIGDTLRNPVAAGDDPADYWFTPIFFSDVWVMRRKFRALDRILNSEIQRGAADEKKETGRGAEDVSDGTVPADEQAESRLQIRFDELGG